MQRTSDDSPFISLKMCLVITISVSFAKNFKYACFLLRAAELLYRTKFTLLLHCEIHFRDQQRGFDYEQDAFLYLLHASYVLILEYQNSFKISNYMNTLIDFRRR